MDEDGGRAPARKAARAPARFTAELGRRICSRVAAGESQMAICAEEGMPSRSTLFAWVRDRPAFAAAFARARVAGGVTRTNGRLSTFSQAAADEIFARLCEGEALSHICADPALPCMSTVFYWRRQYPEFAAAYRLAREVQAERFCDLGWEIACGITPATAKATQVKLAQLRWMAAARSPKVYGRLKPQEPDRNGQGGGLTVIVRRHTDAPLKGLGRPLEPGESYLLRQGPTAEQLEEDEDDDGVVVI